MLAYTVWTPRNPPSISGLKSWCVISWLGVTARMVCRARLSLKKRSRFLSARILSHGSGFWRRRRRHPRNSSTHITNEASRCSACVRPRSPGSICNARRMKTSRNGRMRGSGKNFAHGRPRATAGDRPKDRFCKKGSPGCGAWWLSPCSTAGFSWRAMPLTLSHPPGRKE